jgi:hypothetical protein
MNSTRSTFLRSVLPAAMGAGALLASGSSAATTPVPNYVFDVKVYEAVGDGVTNDQPKIQAAIDAAQAAGGGIVWFPPGRYQLDSTLVISKRVSLEGAGWSPTYDERGGSWLTLGKVRVSSRANGSNAAICIKDTAGGTTIRNLAFNYVQPDSADVVGGFWTPYPHDFAITIDGANDVLIENTHLFNPTKGIKVFRSPTAKRNPGRIRLNGISGQPLQIGIEIDNAMDVCRVSNVHFWPFYATQPSIISYQRITSTGIASYRNDNPCFESVFVYEYKRGFHFGQRIGPVPVPEIVNGVEVAVIRQLLGKTSKFRISDSDLDLTGVGVFVDGDSTDGLISNTVLQGPGINTPLGIHVPANSVRLQISNLRISLYAANGIRIDGAGCIVTLDNVWIDRWNTSGVGFPAIEAVGGSKVVVGKTCQFTGGGTAPFTGGAGVFV